MTRNAVTAAAVHFVQALVEERWQDAEARVSAAVPAGAMSAERLRQMWTQLTGRLGALQSLDALDLEPPAAPADRHQADRHQADRHQADLAARFARSAVTLRVVLDADLAVAGFWVSQPRAPAYAAPPYVDPDAFAEEELAIGREPPLPAVLTRPHGAPAPVVVLVHGSGPNDRDETVGANRPFRDLAWGLASRGVAALRYDKRTFAHPRSLGADVTVEEEVVLDALDAVAAARAVAGVRGDRVFLLGHSLGGTLGPEIAARAGSLAGLVLMAAGARPLPEVLAEQIAYVASLPEAGPVPPEELEQVRQVAAQLAARALPPEANVLGVTARYFYDLEDRRPLQRLHTLPVPVLALHGGRDYQVTAADVARWREALAGHRDAELREYPRLNHLLMPGTGTATPAEYRGAPGHVDVGVVHALADWIHARS